MKKIIEIALIVIIVFVAIYMYPFKIKVKNGETHCYNLFDKEMNCREQSYP